MEETTNIASSGQDVNTQPVETQTAEPSQTDSTETSTPKQTEDQVRKNKEIAVSEERAKRRELEAKLAEYEAV